MAINSKKRVKYLRLLLLIFISIMVVFPSYWAIVNSFKPYIEIYSFPPLYVPKNPTFQHYQVIGDMEFGRYLLNGFIVGMLSAFLAVIIALLPAYAFSKYRIPFKNAMLMSIILLQLLPQAVFVVPIFKILKRASLLNSFFGLSLSYLPFITSVMIMFLKSYFLSIPTTLEEAAIIDGCTKMGAFFRMVLSISIPGIFSSFIYAFLFSWGELMFAMSFLTDPYKQTISVFLTIFAGQYQTRWGPLFAGSVLATLPALGLFAILQRYFVSGLVAGALKE